MRRQQRMWIGAVSFACAILTPIAAFAQSGIAGVVKDTSGGVLPGVSVEAASPVLIEKVRTATTDSDGSYKITDLRPGPYTVTFALQGFSSVKREGINLPASFTATVNVEMGVGLIAETITVSGAAPLVDVHSATSQTLMPKEVLEAIPVASTSPQGFAALTPGITSVALGSIGGGRDEMNLSNHGSATAESLFVIDGVNTADSENVGGAQTLYRMSQAYVSEIAVMTGGGTAEAQFGGTTVNVIPKEGGNKWTGGFFSEYSGSNLQADNLTPELRKQGLMSASALVKLWDASPAFGGPLVTDKLWFFSSYRNAGNTVTRAGLYENLTPTGTMYTPNFSRPAVIKITDVSYNTRLTWQATRQHKVGLFFDYQPHIVHQRNYQAQVSPEATSLAVYPNRLKVLTWKTVLSSKLLFDANISHNTSDTDKRRQPGVGTDIIGAREATTGIVFRANVPLTGGTNYGHAEASGIRTAASVSYITGSHSFKAGMTLGRGKFRTAEDVNGDLAYNLRNGLPTSIVQYANPSERSNEIPADLGIFVQDQWTAKRLTVTPGVRFDYLNLKSIDQDLGAGRWVPARHFAAEQLALWKDVSPRFGMSYDLFGDGKTAVKASVGRFIAGQGAGPQGMGANNPVVRSVLSVTRTWQDLNGNFIPDCDLTNPLANNGADICGQIDNLNFGQSNPLATRYASELINGLRPENWEVTSGVTREVLPGVSITAGYSRRVFGNFRVNDNQFVTSTDYSEYCVTAPSDPRLPGGGGERICGLYDVSQPLFGKSQIVVSPARKFGKQEQVYDGVDLTERIRLAHGVIISGGVNWGRTRTDSCFVIDSPSFGSATSNRRSSPTPALSASFRCHGWGSSPARRIATSPGRSTPRRSSLQTATSWGRWAAILPRVRTAR